MVDTRGLISVILCTDLLLQYYNYKKHFTYIVSHDNAKSVKINFSKNHLKKHSLETFLVKTSENYVYLKKTIF